MKEYACLCKGLTVSVSPLHILVSFNTHTNGMRGENGTTNF